MTIAPPELALSTRPRRSPIPRWVRKWSIPILVIALWELISRIGLVDEVLLPPPSKIVGTIGELLQDGSLQQGILVSFLRAVTGLAIGTVFGVALAVVAGLWRTGEDTFDPIVQLLRPLPATALMPLVVLAMGMDEAPKIFLVSYASFFPVYLNVFQGIRDVDNRLVESAAVFGLRRSELIRQVILPSAMSSFFVGFRFSVSISWVVLVVAEQLNAQSGVGYLMMDAQRYFRADIIFVGLIVYALFGLGSDMLVRLVERRVLRWRNAFAGA
ncbi:ABC transporter permease [Leucobacter allii]|uniref:ABC transporter permease n=1 Tax=Leucobacter allii TaxID=2932247 RepID=A0ABY4FL32_9MICO|nr:ABC transporter permease [Leucobacter allii]UOQ56971.1 ABC transporter permease [Leucobacter allii]UOR01441.1 ABC transporter permease [Leucobacter allii]